MLFLPKYGTNGVCAEARPAQPTTSHAASTGTATSGPRAEHRREGRRMRINSTSDRNSPDDPRGGREARRSLRTDGDLTVTFRGPANADPGVYETFRLCLSSGHASHDACRRQRPETGLQ